LDFNSDSLKKTLNHNQRPSKHSDQSTHLLRSSISLLVLCNCVPFAWPHQPTFLTQQYKQMCENVIRTPFLVSMFYVLFLHGQTLLTVNLRSSNRTDRPTLAPPITICGLLMP
jgi:hypothetical protein